MSDLARRKESRKHSLKAALFVRSVKVLRVDSKARGYGIGEPIKHDVVQELV